MNHPCGTVAPASRFSPGDSVRVAPEFWQKSFGGSPDEPGRELLTGRVTRLHHAGIVSVQWAGGSERNYHEDQLERT